MNLLKPPLLLKMIYGPDVIWNIPSEEDIIFLTFDDGPVPEATPEILTILKKYNAKATFFQVGENVKKYPELYQHVLNEGHSSGNHTFNHLNGWKTKTDDYTRNVEECTEYLDTNLFRPPFGRIKPRQVRNLKKDYKIILWSVLSYDFHSGVTNEQCLENVKKHTKRGSIVVFHDSIQAKEKVLYTLPKVLEYFSEQEYRFEAIPNR